ncbi:MAG: hypothetical protein U9Q03_04825 [Patescibacteria group bacterium]|nr:hypothetical protein [Patescibacteria group bacterium]
MHYVIGVLLLVAAAGFAAGFFLAPIPTVILAIIATAYSAILFRSARQGPPGTSGGIGVAAFASLGLLFLLFLAIGALIGYGSSAITDYDWSSVGNSISEFFLRQ